MILVCVSLITRHVGSVHILFTDVSVQIFGPLKKWVVFLLLSFVAPLYILDANCLLNMCFADICSQSVACPFILWTGSLDGSS